MLQQNRGSRVSAQFTMGYSIMYSHDSTDRSNSLLTSTRDASKCLGNHSVSRILSGQNINLGTFFSC